MTGYDIAAAFAVMAAAFIIGFAIRRGSICMVDATHQWIIHGKTLRIRAFIVAAAASGCLILPLSWLLPADDILAPSAPISLSILAGGAIFGLGARINGGCAFGTLARVSGGQLDYTGSIIGAGLGAISISAMIRPSDTAAPLFADVWPVGAIAAVICAILAYPAVQRRHLRNLVAVAAKPATLMRPFTAMLVIGALGGLLFALAGSWTHLSVIGHEGAFLSGSRAMGAGGKALLGAFALFSGAIFAAHRSGRFAWAAPNISAWLRCLLGGGMMGSGATLIPGGNGALITHGVPSGSLSAWAAMIAIIAVLALSFLPARPET